MDTTDTSAASALSHALTFTIDDVSGQGSETLWAGPLASLGTQHLGTLATGQTRNLRFTLTFPESQATPALQGASTSVRLAILEVSQ